MRYLRFSGSTLTLFLLACPQKTAVWIKPGSTISDLTFRIADKRHGTRAVSVGVFRVDRCHTSPADASEPMWGAGGSTGSRTLTSVIYGRMPEGYAPLIHQGDSALTLVPGCYQATVSGTGWVAFDVTAEGQVIERGGDAR